MGPNQIKNLKSDKSNDHILTLILSMIALKRPKCSKKLIEHTLKKILYKIYIFSSYNHIKPCRCALREIHVRDDDIRTQRKVLSIDNKRILSITIKQIITSERSERIPC